MSGGLLTVMLDSTDVPGGMEVVALSAPSDARSPVATSPTASPALGRAIGRAMSRAHVDSITRFHFAADSASALDDAFQRERTALNTEAAALAAADRRAVDYARRFDAFSPRRQAAEHMRADRDRQRARAAALAARLPTTSLRTEGAAVGTPTPSAGRSTPDSTRYAAPATRPGTTLALPAGTWWVGLATPGAVPRTTIPVTVRDGARDTVRLRMGSGPDR